MATMTKTMETANRRRDHRLTALLENRRRELLDDVQAKIRDGRRGYSHDREVLDEGDSSEVDIQDAIAFALLQMKAETLKMIDVALRRLVEGTYGQCFECGDAIAEARLQALPFAARCTECEDVREVAEGRERGVAHRHSSFLADKSN